MIRAELSEHPDRIRHICTAEGITAISYSPVVALCRHLIRIGLDPITPMEVYRGDVLALKVRSIAEGAKLRVTSSAEGRPIFKVGINKGSNVQE